MVWLEEVHCTKLWKRVLSVVKAENQMRLIKVLFLRMNGGEYKDGKPTYFAASIKSNQTNFLRRLCLIWCFKNDRRPICSSETTSYQPGSQIHSIIRICLRDAFWPNLRQIPSKLTYARQTKSFVCFDLQFKLKAIFALPILHFLCSNKSYE